MERDIEERAKQTTEELERALEHLAVQADLAGMEARDAWNEDLKPRLEEMKRSLATVASEVRATTDEARLQAHLGAEEARDLWEEIRPELRRLVDDLEREGADAKTTLDRARLKAHLGRLDAEDLIRARGEKVKARLAKGAEVARGELRGLLDDLRESVGELRGG